MPDLLLSMGVQSVSDAALWGGLLATLYALMQLLCSPLLGALSDRFGRRPVMLSSLFAMAIDYVVLSAASALWVLLVGRAIAGIMGATYATASAYIADVSPPAERARRFGFIGAVFGLGFVMGPALGGLVGEWHVRGPFMLAAVLAAANGLLAYFYFSETLPVASRRLFSWRRANPFGALRRALSLPALRWLLVGYLLLELGNHVYPSVWSYWSKSTFNWSVTMIGISLAAYGIGLVVVQGTLVRPVVKRLGEPRTILVGLTMGALAAFSFGFAGVDWLVFALIPFAALSDLAGPALTSLMSARVEANEQGELQGVLASLTALASVAMPPLATYLFYTFTREAALLHFPGAPFVLSGLFIAVAIPLMWRTLFRNPGVT